MNKLMEFLDKNEIPVGEFAKALGVTQPLVSKWLHGSVVPGLKNSLAIERVTLGVVKPKDWITE